MGFGSKVVDAGSAGPVVLGLEGGGDSLSMARGDSAFAQKLFLDPLEICRLLCRLDRLDQSLTWASRPVVDRGGGPLLLSITNRRLGVKGADRTACNMIQQQPGMKTRGTGVHTDFWLVCFEPANIQAPSG